jgi:hypothetical protein
MNWTSRFLIEAVGAMVLVSFGGGFVPTASACSGDACKSQEIVGSGQSIHNSDNKTKITVTGCTMPSKDALKSDPSSSACASGSKFEQTIDPGKSWTGPSLAKDMVRVVLTAKFVSEPAKAGSKAPVPTKVFGCTAQQLSTALAKPCFAQMDEDLAAGKINNYHAVRCTGNVLECCVVNGQNLGSCRTLADVGTSGKTNCETFNGDKYVVWKAEHFTRKDNGKCLTTFSCVSTLQEPFSALCKVKPVDGLYSIVEGSCTDAKCSDCRANPPAAKCTATFVQK